MLSLFSTTFAVVLDTPHTLNAAARRARRSPGRTTRRMRTLQLFAGLLAVGTGVAMVITAGLGVASWDVLNVALTDLTGLPLSVIVVAVGLLAACLATALGQRPTLGTLVPLAVVSPVLDAVMRVIETPGTFVGQLTMLVGGMIVLAVGIGSYVGADHGAGPADLVFLGLARRGMPVWAARLTVDGVIGTAGWLLGGPIGLGTIVITVGTGPLVGLAIRAFDLHPARIEVDRYRSLLADLWVNDPTEDLHGIGPVALTCR